MTLPTSARVIDMDPLNAVDVRVLGSLIEKEVTTPDNYPLSLNALVNACNQSSNRDPVMQLDETIVTDSLERLRRKSLVRSMRKSDSRVSKFSHLMADAMHMDPRALAVMCVLMLRGPQTLGELRTRTERLADFTSIAEIEATLSELAARLPLPLVTTLPRRPGQKETRYAHLLSGDAAEVEEHVAPSRLAVPSGSRAANHDGGTDSRVDALESTVDELRTEVAELRRQLEEFRKQFD